MAPGASVTCTATYTVTQADLNNGSINDSATAAGTNPAGGTTTSGPSTASVTTTQSPALTITKTASPTTVAAVGAVVTYSFVVTNSGNVTLTNVAVTDTQTAPAGAVTSGPTCPAGAASLAPGASVTCTATYTTTQADLNNGSIKDSATAAGKDPKNNTVTSAPATATVTTTQSPALTIAKSANPTTVSTVGATVTYSFVVKNTGNVTLTNVAVTDTQTAPAGPLTSGPTCPAGAASLAPGASVTCTATYTTTLADLNNGSINDSATAAGTNPAGGTTTSTPSAAAVTTTQAPALTIAKSASPTTVSAVGAVVTYTFVITNTGNVTLTNVAVTDAQTAPAGSLTSGPTCPAGVASMAPGASLTCTATYTTTQADLNNGSIKDSATAAGKDPKNNTVTSATATATVTTTQSPALTIAKSASPTTVAAVGAVVTYSFAVTNSGNVTLTNVAVTDTQTAPAAALTSGPTCPAGATSMAPGASVTCTATYTVTQADLNNGSINDSATAAGTNPAGGTTTSTPSAATVSTVQGPSLTISKTASPTTVSTVGAAVTYTFVVTNSGNVTLTNVAVTDTQAAPSGSLTSGPTCPAGAASMTPGASVTCTATYTTTQADITNGSIRDSATASGKDPKNNTVTSTPATATVTATQTSALTLTKSASPTTVTAAGQTVTYSFLVKNTGNIPVTGLGIADTFTAPAGPVPTITCPVTSLAPGASTTCAASYVTTQGDIDKGSINNSATASATDSNNHPVTSAPSLAAVTATQTSGLTLTKSANPTTITAPGVTVNYSFVVTNSGNVTITGLNIADTFTAPAGPVPTITCPTTTLAPGASTTCTAAYTTTQADVDNGTIKNSATATGTDPKGAAVTSNASAATVTVTRAPKLALIKSANPTTITAAGQTVTYSFAVTNTGNVSLTGLNIADTFTAPAGPVPTITCPSTTLAPGATVTCTATYLASQADVDNGSINNAATATAKDPANATVTAPQSTATVSVTRAAALTLTKSANPTAVTAAGQTVTYTFAVTNSGNVTVTGLSIADTFTAPAGPALTITCLATTLAPAASTACTATYAVTQADVDNGTIKNSAVANAVDPSSNPVASAPSTATVTAAAAPKLTLAKSANPTSVTATGQTVAYSFKVTNSGNVTVSGVSIADTFTAPAGPVPVITCPVTTLAPGASVTCTGTYATTQADINNGSINNSATASGKDPSNNPVVSNPSTAAVTATQTPKLTLTKSANPTSVSSIGQTVNYSFLVTNTGNVTVSSLTIADSFTAPAGPVPTITCPVTTLAPGASVTCTATYTATAADLDAGTIKNSATATAKDPSNITVTSNASTATVTATQLPKLTVTKSANPVTLTAAGQTVGYTFVVQNTGNVTVSNLTIADSFTAPAGPVPAVTCSVTTLAAGASTTCTSAAYSATQADVNNGTITDTATADGTSPTGSAVVSAPSTATVTINQMSGLTLVKSVSPTTATAAGQTVTYTFAVTNSGNLPVSGLSIADTFTAPAGPAPTIVCVATGLAPGASTTCSATYTVTQADVDTGTIKNSATANATDSNNKPVGSAPSTATVTITAAPALTLVKSVSPTSVSGAGQTVTYSFKVTNSGNVTISGLTIADTFTAPAGPVPTIACPATTLAPGATTTCTATYSASPADADTGTIKNSATASGTDPKGTAVTSAPSTATVTIPVNAALSLVKSVSPTTFTTVGQQLSYTFAVHNGGNVTLSLLTIGDSLTAPAGPALTINCPTTTLAPGANTTCTASLRRDAGRPRPRHDREHGDGPGH